MAEEDRNTYGFSEPFLDAFPEIGDIVDRATTGGWTTEKFLDEVRKTDWWKKKSDAQRRWDVMAVDNPRELADMVRKATQSVATLGAQMGINLGGRGWARLAREVVRSDLSEAQIRAAIARAYRSNKGGLSTTGTAGQAVVDLKKMAGDYGLKATSGMLRNFSAGIAQGLYSSEQMRSYFMAHAKRQYAGVADQIDKGFTVRQILDPYLQTAAEELGVNPSSLDITDGKWTAALQFREKNGDPRAMTNDEWVRKLRTDKSYGHDKSQGAQRTAAVFAKELMSAFGRMG